MLRYAITDRRRGVSSPETSVEKALARVLDRCTQLAPTNLDLLLVREKDLAPATLVPFLRRVVEVFHGTSTRVLVSQRADIALAAAAHGVHLSASPGELTPAEVRQVFPRAFVSRSCHTSAEVAHGRSAAADAILFGPVFGKVVAGAMVSPALGLEALRQACISAGQLPVFALGGVTHANASQCIAAGAAGVAGIRLFFADSSKGI